MPDQIPAPEPHDERAERAVLAAVLRDRDECVRLWDLLDPRDFYSARHAAIFAAMCSLFARQVPPDYVTVCSELEGRGQLDLAGGDEYVSGLLLEDALPIHVEHHAAIVLDRSRRRALLARATRDAKAAYDLSAPAYDPVPRRAVAAKPAVVVPRLA